MTPVIERRVRAVSKTDTENLKAVKKPICKPKRILQAVSILRQLNAKYYESAQKKPLLDDVTEKNIFLQVTMKKIPGLKLQKNVKVLLPNPLITESSEVCLIAGDLDKRNRKAEIDPDVLHYKELLKKEGINQVNEVMTLRQLRTEYKPFEAKRKLAGAYDYFLCDKKITGVLPQLLGKNFFKQRKMPIQINMNTSNLKLQVDKALSSTTFHVSCKGNSCISEVATLSMEDENLLANIQAAVEVLSNELHGKFENILGLYLKTDKSKAIPIYMSFDNPNDIDVKAPVKREKIEAEELSTMLNTKVKVFQDGRIVVKRTTNSDDDEEEELQEKVVIKKRK